MKNRIFLTPTEALSAIRADFHQYDPQKLLFLELSKLILPNENTIKKDPKGAGVWMSSPHTNRMKYVSFADLGEHLIQTLENKPPSLDVLAKVCRRVFRTKAYPGKDDTDNHSGIWVETDMDTFNCKQCGRCCLTLNYNKECTMEDYRNWEANNRKDIMEWVQPVTRDGRIVSLQMWIKPGTSRYVEGCPWLRKIPDKNRYECQIHDTRPEICRQYPGTRKHAEMTGCTGFKIS